MTDFSNLLVAVTREMLEEAIVQALDTDKDELDIDLVWNYLLYQSKVGE